MYTHAIESAKPEPTHALLSRKRAVLRWVQSWLLVHALMHPIEECAQFALNRAGTDAVKPFAMNSTEQRGKRGVVRISAQEHTHTHTNHTHTLMIASGSEADSARIKFKI